MKFWSWFSSRGVDFIGQRSIRVLRRYNILPNRAINRIKACVTILSDHGCYPTFPTPGIIVERYPKFIFELQELGVEIAVHGYQHLDLKTYTVAEASSQLDKAARIFKKNGIHVFGFRCPYLGFNEGLFDALPQGLFEYSSNSTIDWNLVPVVNDHHDHLVFNTIEKFYRAKPSNKFVTVPWMRSHLLEIPICIPDDIQLMDGLGLTSEGISNIWREVLRTTYARGELFNLIFHPELAALFNDAFSELLNEAHSLSPSVWIARLFEISKWWNEKADFKVDYAVTPENLRINFLCSPRATILVKGLENLNPSEEWDGPYRRLREKNIILPATIRPFIGLSPDIPDKTTVFLRDQGYILDRTEMARTCSIFLDKRQIDSLSSEVDLIDFIESKEIPLVRFWRWPDGAKSALCVTGDLDALSLLDYSSRIFTS